MGVDRSLTCYVDLSYSSIIQLPWWLGSAPRRESASGHHGQRPAPAHPRERPSGEHAHLMTSAGRQPCPGPPACTPPCQDCSNRAILARPRAHLSAAHGETGRMREGAYRKKKKRNPDPRPTSPYAEAGSRGGSQWLPHRLP